MVILGKKQGENSLMSNLLCSRCGTILKSKTASHDCIRAYDLSIFGKNSVITVEAPNWNDLMRQMREAGYGEHRVGYRCAGEGPSK